MSDTHRHFTVTTESAVARVDCDSGYVYGVKLLGPKSKNGRVYLPEAMREATPLYNGRKVFLNHPKRNEAGEDRSIQDWVGVIKNACYKPDEGIFGDIVLRKQSPHYAAIIEAATTFANSFGCSHVADGDSAFRNGVEVVHRITDVRSVDLVCEPATTQGLFESTIFGQGAPYGDATCQPVNTLHDDFDRLMIDILGQVTMATHDGQHKPLSELSARLHVLTNELSWFNSRSISGGDADNRISAMRELVYRLDAVLVDPTQPGAIEKVEAELTTLANLLHGEPNPPSDTLPPVSGDSGDPRYDEFDWSNGSGLSDPGFPGRFGEAAKRAAAKLAESRR
jgi:hypothetical protein